MSVDKVPNLTMTQIEAVKKYCNPAIPFDKCWPQSKVLRKDKLVVNLNNYIYNMFITFPKTFDSGKFQAYCKYQESYTNKYFSDCINPYHLQLVSRSEVRQKNKEFREKKNKNNTYLGDTKLPENTKIENNPEVYKIFDTSGLGHVKPTTTTTLPTPIKSIEPIYKLNDIEKEFLDKIKTIKNFNYGSEFKKKYGWRLYEIFSTWIINGEYDKVKNNLHKIDLINLL